MLKKITSRKGSIEFSHLEEIPNTFQIVPRGVVSLTLLKEYISFIEQLDQHHTQKYNHIVDTTLVQFANPLNPFILRRISKLKNINYYIVIVPSAFLRIIVSLTKWINKPDYVFRSVDEAYRFLINDN